MRHLDEPVHVRDHRRPVSPVGPGTPATEAGPGGPGTPEQFIWRGRLYVVRAVVDHWREPRPWWRDLTDGTATHLAPYDPLAPENLEHQVWRVEATPGRTTPPGVYDLRHTPDGWRLDRLAD